MGPSCAIAVVLVVIVIVIVVVVIIITIIIIGIINGRLFSAVCPRTRWPALAPQCCMLVSRTSCTAKGGSPTSVMTPHRRSKSSSS